MSIKYFETIKCDDYEVFSLDYHEKRVAKSVALNLNLQDYVYPPSHELFRCKVIYSQDGIEDVQYFKYKKRDIKSFKIVVDDDIDYSKKFLNRDSLDRLFEKKEDADEIIILKDGFVTDTSIANIAIFDGTNWITPKKPLLKGTTRARLLEEKIIFEKDISLEMLQSAKRFALMNAMIDFDIIEDYSFFL
jgi:4-amino-4-deoxychorismate lyase